MHRISIGGYGAQGADKHRSLFEAFSGMREGGENPESVSTFGGATAQRYAAAARSGSMPHDPGSSWPRSVMHGPDKHRSLFEAFGNLKPPPAGGANALFLLSAYRPLLGHTSNACFLNAWQELHPKHHEDVSYPQCPGLWRPLGRRLMIYTASSILPILPESRLTGDL